MEEVPTDSEVFRHSVKVPYRIGKAHEMAEVIGDVDEIGCHLVQTLS